MGGRGCEIEGEERSPMIISLYSRDSSLVEGARHDYK